MTYSIKRAFGNRPWVTLNGEPLDWPDDEPRPLNATAYDRPSEVAGLLDTKENLSPYHQAQAVLGAVTDKGLAWHFRALASQYEDPWVEAKDEVKDLLRQARRLGGEDRKSNQGSSIHRYCEMRDKAMEVKYPVPQMEPWIEVYGEKMSRFEVLDWECFVVNDEVRCAGTYDRLVRDKETGDVMIADIKSGASDPDFAMKPTIQVAIYANSVRYDQESGARTPIHPDLCSRTGLLIHVPFNGGGEPRCNIYRLDLDYGFDLARLAKTVAAARKLKLGKKDILV